MSKNKFESGTRNDSHSDVTEVLGIELNGIKFGKHGRATFFRPSSKNL